MVAAENGIGMFTETIAHLIDRGVVFRPLNTQVHQKSAVNLRDF